VVRTAHPFATLCADCREEAALRAKQLAAVLALALWRTAFVGSLHAFSSVSISLLVEHQLSPRDAGSLVATIATLSIVCMPLLLLCGGAHFGLCHSATCHRDGARFWLGAGRSVPRAPS
jgi:hypothetical protein